MTASYRIPVVSIVGKSDSGKTTVMEGLIRELSAMGYRVATVKHHIHEVDVDVPGKDSWRHAHAGSVTAMISSPTQFAVVRRVPRSARSSSSSRPPATPTCSSPRASSARATYASRSSAARAPTR